MWSIQMVTFSDHPAPSTSSPVTYSSRVSEVTSLRWKAATFFELKAAALNAIEAISQDMLKQVIIFFLVNKNSRDALQNVIIFNYLPEGGKYEVEFRISSFLLHL